MKRTIILKINSLFLAMSLILGVTACQESEPKPPQELPAFEQLQSQTALPDPLLTMDGSPVIKPEQWRTRRLEIQRMFEYYVYGKAPGKPANLTFTIERIDANYLNGKAVKKEVTLRFGPEGSPPINLLLVIPKKRQKPAPVFLTLNFLGNHTVISDPAIPIHELWVNDQWYPESFVNNQATEASRGIRASRFEIEKTIDRGYAIATFYNGDIDPDTDDFTDGIGPFYYSASQMRPGPHEWGTIAAWGWGLSRGVDYLLEDKDIDGRKIAVVGHSRNGKAALLAGALDERIALVISNQSGCGGASLSRHKHGESVKQINDVFPHWFCDEFKKFNEKEQYLPVDQHMLIAMVAPRPVLICSATDDQWADPEGEFLALKAASPVYELLTGKGVPSAKMPEINRLTEGLAAYHIRPGKHGIGEKDWAVFMDFADAHSVPVVNAEKIWDNGQHNAFTDLIRFNGKFYCSFREGPSHSPGIRGGDGGARIIVSGDGNNWRSAVLLKKEGFDLRDPKLSITPDERLMVIMGGSVYEKNKLIQMAPHVCFSDDGKKFSEPEPVKVDKSIRSNWDWLWRVNWYGRTGYGVIYHAPPDSESKVALVKTKDGVNYKLISNLDVDGNPNEATVRIMDDDEMLILLRREEGNGYMGHSQPPYTSWKWNDVGLKLGGSDFIELPDSKLIVGTRVYSRQIHTALFLADRKGNMDKLFKLPSGGDNSYPGMIVYQEKLLVSYYSSHEGKTSVYLVKIPLADITKTNRS